MASLRELARRTGLSIATVSKALRNDPSVRPDTKNKVLEAARALNYTPNRLVEGIFKGKTRTIAILGSNLADSASPRRVSQMLDCVQTREWGALVMNTHGSTKDEEDCIRQCIGMRVSGAIIAPVNFESQAQHYNELIRNKIPFIITGEFGPDLAIPHVRHDDYQGAIDLLTHLTSLGHKDIVFLGGPEPFTKLSQRTKAFREFMAQEGIKKVEDRIINCGWEIEDACTTTEQLLNKPNKRPTAIFAANDALAIGIINTILAHGLKVPDDISVVAMGDSMVADVYSPKLTYFREPMDTLAKRTIEVLFEIMDYPPDRPIPRTLLDILIPGEVIIGETSGPCPKN